MYRIADKNNLHDSLRSNFVQFVPTLFISANFRPLWLCHGSGPFGRFSMMRPRFIFSSSFLPFFSPLPASRSFPLTSLDRWLRSTRSTANDTFFTDVFHREIYPWREPRRCYRGIDYVLTPGCSKIAAARTVVRLIADNGGLDKGETRILSRFFMHWVSRKRNI